VLELLSILTFL